MTPGASSPDAAGRPPLAVVDHDSDPDGDARDRDRDDRDRDRDRDRDGDAHDRDGDRDRDGDARDGDPDRDSDARGHHEQAAAAASRPPGRSRLVAWSRGWRLVLVVALALAATRWPGLTDPKVFNNDEVFVATQAQVLNRGGGLYTQAVDRKPPVVPALTALTFRVVGDDDLRPVRGLAAVSVGAAAVLLAGIARRRAGGGGAGDSAEAAVAALGAALGLVAVTVALPSQDGQSFTFEAFALLPMVAAVALADRRRWAGAGLALAVAALTKQTALVTAAPVLWLAWRHARSRAVAIAQVVAATVVPVVVVAAAMGWHQFWFWVATGDAGYLQAEDLDKQIDLGADRVQAWLVAVAPIVVLAVVALGVAAHRSWSARSVATPRVGSARQSWSARPAGGPRVGSARQSWSARSAGGPRVGSALVWLAAVVPAVCAGWRFFPHYLIQAGPPLALLAALGLAVLRRPLQVAMVAVAVVMTARAVDGADEAKVTRPPAPVVRAIDRYSEPGQPIFVWGMYPTAYWASERPPATRFINIGFLTNISGGILDPGQVAVDRAVPGTWDELFADLRADPPAVVVDTTMGTAIDTSRFPAFRDWLVAHYDKVEWVDATDIWQRKAAP